MPTDHILSVQSINCPDELTREIEDFLAHKKKLPPQAGCRHRSAHPPRLSHRALHPLRKARMQVCGWPRAWPQILPVRQLSRSKTPARLRSPAIPETRRAIPRQLPETQNTPGTHLRHQSGASSKEGRTVTDGWITCRRYSHRCSVCRDNTRQYAAEPFGCEQKLPDRSTGGYR